MSDAEARQRQLEQVVAELLRKIKEHERRIEQLEQRSGLIFGTLGS